MVPEAASHLSMCLATMMFRIRVIIIIRRFFFGYYHFHILMPKVWLKVFSQVGGFLLVTLNDKLFTLMILLFEMISFFPFDVYKSDLSI